MLILEDIARYARLGKLCRVIGGVCLIACADRTADATLPPVKVAVRDGRIAKLEAFFRSYNCPEPHYSQSYLQAADENDLDYRLLPAISVRESTCGIHSSQNNYWGWDSARRGFESVTAGIGYVAAKLAHGQFYRNKTVGEKLRAYNPRAAYAGEVFTLMQEIESMTP